MEEEERIEIEALINMRRMTKFDANRLEYYVRKFVDKKTHVCGHCAAQMKFAQKRLATWFANETKTEEVIVEPITKGVTEKVKKGLVINTKRTKK